MIYSVFSTLELHSASCSVHFAVPLCTESEGYNCLPQCYDLIIHPKRQADQNDARICFRRSAGAFRHRADQRGVSFPR